MIINLGREKDKKKVVETAVEILKAGGVLVFPTETAYGFVADAGNKKAIQKIYKIKGRMASKFLPLIVGSLEQMEEFFELGKKELGLAKKYKGLTIILKTRKHRNTKTQKQGIYLFKGQKTCAVRISKYKLARELALKLGRPITATSANVSGGENCYNAGEAMKQFGLTNIEVQSALKHGGQARLNQGKIDLIIDGGKLKKRKPSTIVKVEGGKVKVVRQGEVAVKR